MTEVLGTALDRNFRNNANDTFDEHETEITNLQAQLDQLVIYGDSSPAAQQAAVNAQGVKKSSLKTRLDDDYNELSANIADLEESVTVQLETKADQSFVDAQFASIVSGAPKATYSTLSALQTAYPNGTEGIFLVLANGHWYYWNADITAWADGGVYQATGLGNGSVTTTNLGDGIITEQKLNYSYRRGEILSSTINVDTVNKNVSVAGTCYVGVNGKYYTVSAQTVAFTGLISRVNFVYLNVNTLNLEVYETGLSPNTPNLVLLFSFYNGEVQNTTTGRRITLDGAKASNISIGKGDLASKFQRASILSGTITITVDSVAKTGKVESSALQISKNGVYNNIPNTVIDYTWTSNRIQYVYVKENTNTLVVYENGLAPDDPYLVLLFSYFNGNVYNCDNLKGIIYNGKTLTAEVSPTNLLYGKKANFLGDSITDDTHPAATVKYHKLIQERYGLALVRNYGISGSRITVGNTDAMATRYVDMDNDADYIVVFAGTNDCGGGQTLENFRASVKTLFSGLIDKYPTKKILIVTPLQSSYANRIDALKDYVDIEIEEAAYYGIPVLDLHRGSGISSRNQSQIDALMPDGLHPNNAGHEQIAMKIGEAMRAL